MSKRTLILASEELYEPEGKKIYRNYKHGTRRVTYMDEFYGSESKELIKMLDIGKGTNSQKIDMLKNMLPKIIEGELTELQKRCVAAYYFEGINTSKISQQEGISPSRVSARMGKE